MTPKRLSIASGGVALLALIVVGLLQLSGEPHSTGRTSTLSAAQVKTRLAGSPPALEALHNQADRLLDGGRRALEARLATLHGRPLVINKWASWCAPCRSEFGAFQRASVDLGREVAFVGIDSGDTSRSSAVAFLRSFPVSYPSYYDPRGSLGAAITDSTSMPVTVFHDARGREFIHQGPYLSAAELERDIRRYALEA